MLMLLPDHSLASCLSFCLCSHKSVFLLLYTAPNILVILYLQHHLYIGLTCQESHMYIVIYVCKTICLSVSQSKSTSSLACLSIITCLWAPMPATPSPLFYKYVCLPLGLHLKKFICQLNCLSTMPNVYIYFFLSITPLLYCYVWDHMFICLCDYKTTCTLICLAVILSMTPHVYWSVCL